MPRYRILALPVLDELKKNSKMVFYGARTPWWVADDLPYKNHHGLPSDPLGGVLFQTEDILGYFKAATSNESHYGKHGIQTFRAAFHGVVEVFKRAELASVKTHPHDRWIPTAFTTWDKYDKALDLADPKTGEFEL